MRLSWEKNLRSGSNEMQGCEEEDDQLKVELGLADNCQSQLYESSINLLDFGLQTMGLEMSADEADKLDVKNRPRMCQSSKEAPRLLETHVKWLARFWNSRPGLLFRCVFPIYYCLKYTTIAWLNWNFDKIAAKKQIGPARGCAQNGSHVDWSPLVSVWNRLDFIGSILSGTSFSFTCPLVVIYPLAMVLVVRLAVRLFDIRIDWLAFLREPLKERHRIQCELDWIVAKLIVASRQQAKGVDARLGYLRCEANCKAIHLTHRWHKRMLSVTSSTLYYSLVIATILIVFIHSNFLIYALRVSLKTRLALVDCRKRQPPADLATWSRFSAKTMSNSEFEAYASYDNSSWSQYLYQLLVVEPKNILTWQSLYTLLEMGLVQIICIFWIGICLLIYLVSVANQLIWVGQIKSQLESCIRLMRDEHCDQQSLLRAFSGAYLSYALFKRQYRTPKKLAKILCYHASMTNLLHLAALSLAKKAMNSYNTTELYGVIVNLFLFFIISINGYFGAYSYLYLQIERMMQQIATLIAAYERHVIERRRSASVKFWGELWRRQLLDGAAMAKFYGIDLFGVQVAFTNLVQVNVYPVAILAYLL